MIGPLPCRPEMPVRVFDLDVDDGRCTSAVQWRDHSADRCDKPTGHDGEHHARRVALSWRTP